VAVDEQHGPGWVDDDGAGALVGHPQQVVGVALAAGWVDIGESEADPRAVVEGGLAVGVPASGHGDAAYLRAHLGTARR
jgi:hypothetical protein